MGAFTQGPTHGPWELVPGSESCHCCFHWSILPPRNPDEPDDEYRNSIAEVLCGTDEDAKLIAAAPELLEALEIEFACGLPSRISMYDEEGVEGWLWVHPDGREWSEVGSWDQRPPMHPVARAAIAKARGEA